MRIRETWRRIGDAYDFMLYLLSRKAGIRYKGDERILGDSEFVERVLKADEERLERRYALQAKRYDFDAVVVQVAKH